MAIKNAYSNYGYEVVDGSLNYGRYIYNHNSKSMDFISYGRYVGISTICRDLDGGDTVVTIEFDDIDGNHGSLDIDRGLLSKKRDLHELLLRKGADVHEESLKVLLNCLRQTEDDADRGWCFRKTGWIIDSDNEASLSFKGGILICNNPEIKAHYVGPYDLSKKGTFSGWKAMILKHVIGHAPLEVTVLIGLSPIISSLCGARNLLFHFMGDSGKGKTTSGILALSVASCPNPSETAKRVSPEGKPLRSLMSSWKGTSNALTAKLNGLDGTLMVFDELSKVEDPSILTSAVYTVSDGEDKDRMLNATELQPQSVVRTNILSLGEESLIEKAECKNSGINVRVLEISGEFTRSAEEAEAITAGCYEHYGHAANRFAKHIVENMSLEEVKTLRTKNLDIFEAALAESGCKAHSLRRLAEFGAVLLTVAEIAEPALGINFSREAITDFLVEQHCASEKHDDIGVRAHDALRGYITTHVANFATDKDAEWRKSIPCLGRIDMLSDGTTREVSIPTSEFPKIMKTLGFNNSDLIIKKFKAMGLLSFESGKNYRKRMITIASGKVRVFVVRFP